jgi:single-strand DNA-binding protein
MTINKVILVGNLGNDPEIKISTKEKKFAKLSVATHEVYNNAKGEKTEKTQWHNVVVFDPRIAETVEKHYKKGMQVYVEGQLETRKYEHNGENRYTTEVVVPQYSGDLKIVGKKDSGNNTSTDKDNLPDDDISDIPF